MRSAKRCSASGGITSSFCATAYQVGTSFFHAEVPITSSKAVVGRGCCTAYMTFASIGSHPPQSDARVHAQDVTLDRDGTTGLVRKNRLHRTHRTTVAFAGTRGTKPAFCTTT